MSSSGGDPPALNGDGFTTIDRPGAGDDPIRPGDPIEIRGTVAIPPGVDRKEMIRKGIAHEKTRSRKDRETAEKAGLPAPSERHWPEPANFTIDQVEVLIEVVRKGGDLDELICYARIVSPERMGGQHAYRVNVDAIKDEGRYLIRAIPMATIGWQRIRIGDSWDERAFAVKRPEMR